MANPNTATLSEPVAREVQHFRDYVFKGFRRVDGLYDIEGQMTDRKTYAFPSDFRGTVEPGEPLHDMRIRLTVDDEFMIRGIECVTSASPYAICPDITPSFNTLVGQSVGRGWSRVLRQKFGGKHGCVHHVEMLRAMATVVFQTIYGHRERLKRETGRLRGEGGPPTGEGGAGKKPGFLDTCHALASDGEIVRTKYPQFYTPREQ